jgi:dinuclear metal center YbgI/SA1388 family protein
MLFSLDLSNESVKKAIELGCDTIVTHHPAIYTPVKSLSVDSETAPVTLAVMNKINVISMHLNLDMATTGIDYDLALALGGKDHKIIDYLDEKHGYGRELNLTATLSELVERIKTELCTDKVICYGESNDFAKTVATFCGGGASNALELVQKGKTKADTIVTSDMAHHVLKELIELGKNVIIIPHYASEDYGFKKFYLDVLDKTKENIESYYFEDKRFK